MDLSYKYYFLSPTSLKEPSREEMFMKFFRKDGEL